MKQIAILLSVAPSPRSGFCHCICTDAACGRADQVWPRSVRQTRELSEAGRTKRASSWQRARAIAVSNERESAHEIEAKLNGKMWHEYDKPDQ